MAAPSFPPELRLLTGSREQARALAPAGAAGVSRSYSDPYALVAWHHGPVGVDIEEIRHLDAAFCDVACTPAERPRLIGADPELMTSLWSSKEALAKALGDAGRYDAARLEAPLFWPGGRAGRWRARRLEVPAGYVGWLCWSE